MNHVAIVQASKISIVSFCCRDLAAFAADFFPPKTKTFSECNSSNERLFSLPLSLSLCVRGARMSLPAEFQFSDVYYSIDFLPQKCIL